MFRPNDVGRNHWLRERAKGDLWTKIGGITSISTTMFSPTKAGQKPLESFIFLGKFLARQIPCSLADFLPLKITLNSYQASNTKKVHHV